MTGPDFTTASADGHRRSTERWLAEEESAMVNGFDEGWSIAAIGALLCRDPAVVRARLYEIGRLPACDPMRAEEDRRIGEKVRPGGARPDWSATPDEAHTPGDTRTGRGPVGRLFDRFLRLGS